MKGISEMPPFDAGTKAVAEAVAATVRSIVLVLHNYRFCATIREAFGELESCQNATVNIAKVPRRTGKQTSRAADELNHTSNILTKVLRGLRRLRNCPTQSGSDTCTIRFN